MISNTKQTIDVKVTSILFPKETRENGGFYILRTSRCVCKGVLPFAPEVGMSLKLTGVFGEYHGQLEFKFDSVAHDIPIDSFALLDYVCEITKGLGDKTVAKIKSKYGNDWRKKLDDMPQSWAIPIKRTLASFNSDKHRVETIAFCMSLGLTPRIGKMAFAQWKENSVATIKHNPFTLTQLQGVGFKTVDVISEKLGLSKASIRRATAAVDYALHDMMESSGNSIVSRDELYEYIKGLNVPSQSASVALAKMVDSGRVQFVGFEDITLNTVVKHEEAIWRYVATTKPCNKYNADIEMVDDFKPDDSQIAAINAAVRNEGLTIINGGAGCGKTTIIKQIASYLTANGEQVELCAFAGKAAARLREATGFHASTIHSMLQYCGEGFGFSRGSMKGITIILDEASMLPSSLLYEIVKREPTRLILVGDQAQLHPVGIGSPFHDMIDCLNCCVYTVTTCYRNKEAIFKAAANVRNGLLPEESESRNERFEIRKFNNAEQIHNYLCDQVKDGNIDFSQDLILSPRNGEGDTSAMASVNAVNESIIGIVNPHCNDETFKVNDRVMCVKNDNKLGIWNGTTGWISRIDVDGTPYFLVDDGDEVKLPKDMHKNIVPAYCLTVHKAQGSQYRNVYVVVLKRDQAMLFNRAMLYTAITRAKKTCVILTDVGLHQAIASVRRRKTYLQTLFHSLGDE